jgi:hypothetical protein
MRKFINLLLAVATSWAFSACTSPTRKETITAAAKADDQHQKEVTVRQQLQNATRIRSIVEKIHSTSDRAEKEKFLLEFRSLYHPLIEAGTVQPYELMFFSTEGAPVYRKTRGELNTVNATPLRELDTRQVHAMLVMDRNSPTMFQPFLICDIDPRFVETYLTLRTE